MVSHFYSIFMVMETKCFGNMNPFLPIDIERMILLINLVPSYNYYFSVTKIFLKSRLWIFPMFFLNFILPFR